MDQQQQQKQKQRKRKNRHRPKGQQKPSLPEFQPVKLDFERVPCSLCHQTIIDLPSALAHGPQGDPVHIECAITLLRETEKPLEGESLIYMGAGHFAIVKRGPPLEIQRKIAFENKDVAPEWKKELKRKALAIIPTLTDA